MADRTDRFGGLEEFADESKRRFVGAELVRVEQAARQYQGV